MTVQQQHPPLDDATNSDFISNNNRETVPGDDAITLILKNRVLSF